MKTLQESILGGNIESDIKHYIEDLELYKHKAQIEDVGCYAWSLYDLNKIINVSKLKSYLQERNIPTDVRQLISKYKLKGEETTYKHIGIADWEDTISLILCYLLSFKLTDFDFILKNGPKSIIDKLTKQIQTLILSNQKLYRTVCNFYPMGAYWTFTVNICTKLDDQTYDSDDVLFIRFRIPKSEFKKYANIQ